MNYRTSFLLFFICFLLQATLTKHIAILGYAPNLILCLVIVLSFLYQEQFGLVYGILFGLLQDVFFGELLGIAAFAYVLIALFIRETKRYLYRDHFLSIIVITLTGTILYSLIFYMIIHIFGSELKIMFILKSLPIQFAYQLLVVIALHGVILRMILKHRGYRYQ